MPDGLPWRQPGASPDVRQGPRLSDRQEQAQAWDRRLSAEASPAPLTQSWAWADVQAAAGWDPIRLELHGGGPVLILMQRAGPVRWGYVPRGPAGCSPALLDELIRWSRQAGLARLRIEPEAGLEVRSLLADLGFRRTVDVQPSRTRILRLAADAEMLASFRRTTRYNIGYAERNLVTVDEGAEAEELARHVLASARRAGVALPGRTYFQLLLDRLPSARTFVARHGGDSLCALLVAVHDGRGYYLFSGSGGLKRHLKPMDLAMWRGIQHAARMGCRDYDLWGIQPDTDPRHPWHGFSEFKRGYGGRQVEYAGTWDLVLSEPGRLVLEARERAMGIYRRMRKRGR